MAKQRSENPKSNPGLEANGILVKSPSGMPILEVKKLSVPEGVCVVVMGSNGAGKSTMLRVLSGHLAAPGCQILFRNARLAPVENRLIPGFDDMFLMPQHSDLDPNSLVADQIAKVLRSFPQAERLRKAKALIQLLKLKSLLSSKVLNLSAGERRRLGFAEVEVQKPAILFLDEPFSDLDPENREQILDLLFRHKRSGASLVLVSHNAEDARLLADQVWILGKGKLKEIVHRDVFGFSPSTLDGARVLGLKNLFLLNDWMRAGFPALPVQGKAKAVHIPYAALRSDGEICIGDFDLESSWHDSSLWFSRWRSSINGQAIMRSSIERPSGEKAKFYINFSEIRFLS